MLVLVLLFSINNSLAGFFLLSDKDRIVGITVLHLSACSPLLAHGSSSLGASLLVRLVGDDGVSLGAVFEVWNVTSLR